MGQGDGKPGVCLAIHGGDGLSWGYLGTALANVIDCSGYEHLLDVAGGSGIYSCAMVARHTHLRATILEKAPVAKLAKEALAERGFAERVSVAIGDMFLDEFPADCDMHLFSNVLHDWDTAQVEELLAKSYSSLKPGGMIVIHDAHINATKTGPLPVAAYSALLMTITEGKCSSEQEMADFLSRAGFSEVKHQPTVADRSVITAMKREQPHMNTDGHRYIEAKAEGESL